MPQGKCRRQGLWPRPHCVPPTLGGHRWEVTRCKEANNSLLNLGLGRDPRPSSACKGAPIHLGPHLPGVVLLEDPPRIPKGLSAQLCTHRHSSGQRWLLETSLGKTISKWGVKGVQGIKPREGRSAPDSPTLPLGPLPPPTPPSSGTGSPPGPTAEGCRTWCTWAWPCCVLSRNRRRSTAQSNRAVLPCPVGGGASDPEAHPSPQATRACGSECNFLLFFLNCEIIGIGTTEGSHCRCLEHSSRCPESHPAALSHRAALAGNTSQDLPGGPEADSALSVRGWGWVPSLVRELDPTHHSSVRPHN